MPGIPGVSGAEHKSLIIVTLLLQIWKHRLRQPLRRLYRRVERGTRVGSSGRNGGEGRGSLASNALGLTGVLCAQTRSSKLGVTRRAWELFLPPRIPLCLVSHVPDGPSAV